MRFPISPPLKENARVKKYSISRDFPRSPVVKNLPSNAGDVGSIRVGELRFHMLWGS